MARICKTVSIAAPPAELWDAIADIGAIHTRVAPRMVADTQLQQDGSVRVVTFTNGAVLSEQIVSLDHMARELVWTAHGGPWTHHNAWICVTDNADGGGNVTWTADVLPDSAGQIIAGFIAAGLQDMKLHHEGTAG